MATTIFVHYRGSRARAFHSERDVSVYLSDFVYRDLKKLGFLRPKAKDCEVAWQAGKVTCRFPHPSLVRIHVLALSFTH